MVTFLIPRSQTLEIADCPKRLAILRSKKESSRISFSRTSSKSPERVLRRTDSEERVFKPKSANRNSWLKSIASSLMSGGSPRSESAPSPPPDAPTHVRRRTRSLIDAKFFTSQAVDVEDDQDPRLPDHMRRPELQLRRIQRRDMKSNSTRSSSVDRAHKYPWWPV